jgi:hypothetical protein
MAKYYEAETLLEFVKQYTPHFDGETTMQCVVKAIKEAPTADVAEVKHGEWIYHVDDLFPADGTIECSVCHEEESLLLYNNNYCPNCGAKMDGEKNG